eukprot:4606565-Pleurochrysis_carterae.AAC.2
MHKDLYLTACSPVLSVHPRPRHLLVWNAPPPTRALRSKRNGYLSDAFDIDKQDDATLRFSPCCKLKVRESESKVGQFD